MSSYASIAQQLASIGQNLPQPDNFGEDAALAKLFGGSGKSTGSSTSTPNSTSSDGTYTPLDPQHPVNPLNVSPLVTKPAPSNLDTGNNGATGPVGLGQTIANMNPATRPLTAAQDPGTQAPSATVNGQPVAGQPNWVANSPSGAWQPASGTGGLGTVTASGGQTSSGSSIDGHQVPWPASAAPGTPHGPPAGGSLINAGVGGTAGPVYQAPNGDIWSYNSGAWIDTTPIATGTGAASGSGIQQGGAGGTTTTGWSSASTAPKGIIPLGGGITGGPSIEGAGKGVGGGITFGIYGPSKMAEDTQAQTPKELARSLLSSSQQNQEKAAKMGVMPPDVQKYVAMKQAANQTSVSSLVGNYVQQQLAAAQKAST